MSNLGPHYADLLQRKSILEGILVREQVNNGNVQGILFALLGTIYDLNGEHSSAIYCYSESEKESTGLSASYPDTQLHSNESSHSAVFMPLNSRLPTQAASFIPSHRWNSSNQQMKQTSSLPEHYSHAREENWASPQTVIQHHPTFYVVSPTLPAEPTPPEYLPAGRLPENIYQTRNRTIPPAIQQPGVHPLPAIIQQAAQPRQNSRPIPLGRPIEAEKTQIEFTLLDEREEQLILEVQYLSQFPEEKIFKKNVASNLRWGAPTVTKYHESLMTKGYMTGWPLITPMGYAYIEKNKLKRKTVDSSKNAIGNFRTNEQNAIAFSTEGSSLNAREHLIQLLRSRVTSNVSSTPSATEPEKQSIHPSRTQPLLLSGALAKPKPTDDHPSVPATTQSVTTQTPLEKTEIDRIRSAMSFKNLMRNK